MNTYAIIDIDSGRVLPLIDAGSASGALAAAANCSGVNLRHGAAYAVVQVDGTRRILSVQPHILWRWEKPQQGTPVRVSGSAL